MSFDPQPESTVWTSDGQVRCSVPRAQIVALAGVAVACLAAGLVSPPAGRLLLFLAALMAGGVAVRDLVTGPTLLTDETGISYVAMWRREHLAWSQIEAIAVYESRRIARVTALELDAGERLVLLPERRLGADVRDVVDALRELRIQHR